MDINDRVAYVKMKFGGNELVIIQIYVLVWRKQKKGKKVIGEDCYGNGNKGEKN